MIIWNIYHDENPYKGECNYFFDWEAIREKNLTDKYVVRRGGAEYKEFDHTIYEILTNPTANVHRISRWISEGPDYELQLRDETRPQTITSQEWDRTPEKISLWSFNQSEQLFDKPKKNGLYRRMRNWIAKTLK